MKKIALNFSPKSVSAVAAAAMFVSTIGMSVSAYDGDYSNLFTFSGSTITAENLDSQGYSIDGSVLTINGVGTFVITGTSDNGSIQVIKGTEGVTLVFENLTLTSTDTAPLVLGKNTETELIIEGSNTLVDAEDPNNEDSEGAAVKVKSGSQLTITGSGTLDIAGNTKNGIKGAESASVNVGGSSSDSFTINISASNNGLASDGSVTVNGGTLNITSGGDGLKSSPDEDDTTSAGTVTVTGGSITINSGEDGIQADGGFTMTDGKVYVTSGGGYTNAANIGDNSAKGIKSDSYITISGGDVMINAADDGIHLNGTSGSEAINITGGSFTIASGDDGIHSDYYLNISGGSVNVTQSVEGLEGAKVNLSSGSGNITSSDDGVNAANSDLGNYDFELNISGGNWHINAGGDGLDSNGNLNVSGGYTEVFGSSNGGNAALDYGDGGYSFNYTGGTIIGVGMGNMATSPTSGTYVMFGTSSMGGMGGMNGNNMTPPEMQNGSTNGNNMTPPDMQNGSTNGNNMTPPDMQSGSTNGNNMTPPEMQNGGANGEESTGVISSGSEIVIKDSDGNVIYSGTAEKNADNVVFASDLLNSGETYYLYCDGELVYETQAVSGSGNAFSGGGMPSVQGSVPTDGRGQNGSSNGNNAVSGNSTGGVTIIQLIEEPAISVPVTETVSNEIGGFSDTYTAEQAEPVYVNYVPETAYVTESVKKSVSVSNETAYFEKIISQETLDWLFPYLNGLIA